MITLPNNFPRQLHYLHVTLQGLLILIKILINLNFYSFLNFLLIHDN
jgi:hypothetical protein